jgi:3-deoxy-7-phosphoheptulonate synthase
MFVAINLDARDPVLASRLNTLGAVQPNPHYSPSSTSSYDPQRNTSSDPTSSYSQPSSMPEHNYPAPTENPALRVLSARQRIQDEADAELAAIGRKGFAGRRYVDAGVIQLALMRKARGEPDARIEQALSIERGRLGVLGRGVFGTVSASN